MSGTGTGTPVTTTARQGMVSLISRWRRLVDDAGTVVWTDDTAQTLLDGFRVDVWGEVLTYIPQYVNATTVYKLYASKYNNLDGVQHTVAFADPALARIQVYLVQTNWADTLIITTHASMSFDRIPTIKV